MAPRHRDLKHIFKQFKHIRISLNYKSFKSFFFNHYCISERLQKKAHLKISLLGSEYKKIILITYTL